MKKLLLFSLTALLILTVVLSGCDGGGKNDGNDGGSDGPKTAAPYPERSQKEVYNSKSSEFDTPNDLGEYFASIFGEKWPEGASKMYGAMMVSNPFAPFDVTVTATEYQMVSDEVFHEYCYWYQPNSPLSITLSSIEETSVSESITKSVGITMGVNASNISGSIAKETTKTVTTAKGIEVATSYDLTQYDQTKRYKVILKGNYYCVRYHMSGGGYSYTDYGIKVDNNSLEVILVHD